MEHRYGRHGPHAWLRWRERRYGRPSRLPVPVEPQPTIVRVHVPINAERIIFIIMSNDPSDARQPLAGFLGEAGQQSDQSADSSGMLPSPPSKEEQEFARLSSLRRLKHHASSDAKRKAEKDRNRLDGVATNDELRAYALRLWNRYEYDRESAIREEAIAADIEGHELLSLYESGIIIVYRSIIKEAPPDNRMKTIQKQAHEDKKWDSDHQVFLSDDERMRQAATRVSERIGLDPQTERLEITRLVRAYESSYQKYDPAQEETEGEEVRDNRNSSFRQQRRSD